MYTANAKCSDAGHNHTHVYIQCTGVKYRGGQRGSQTSSRFMFWLFGLLPVAMSTVSSPSMASSPPAFFLTCRVKVPLLCFSMRVGVLSEWILRPETSYCSAMNWRHSSSKPLRGSGCKYMKKVVARVAAVVVVVMTATSIGN